ncbi:MAG: hypothetical protein JRH20_23285, partial [Deltaproteobacteria bacterium]|nr:hypothetical protein [Deltaproteobacteria bacterium]
MVRRSGWTIIGVLCCLASGCHAIADYEKVTPQKPLDAAIADANVHGDAGPPSDGSLQDSSCPDGGCVAPPPPLQIVAAGDHSCALLADGTVLCWGRNDYGQLGRGDFIDSHTPRHVLLMSATNEEIPLRNVTMLATSAVHACALANGDIYCWGANWGGQASLSATDWRLSRAGKMPLTIVPMDPPKTLALKDNQSCLLTTSGKVWCWGEGSSPAQKSLPGTTAHLACGSYHCCAANTENQFTCWGYNWSGQTIPPPSPSPGTTLVHLAAGNSFNCALLEEALGERSQLCWGEGWFGQFGAPPTYG